MGREQRKSKDEMEKIEITDEILGLFIWGINLDLDKVNPKAVLDAGFPSLKEACYFWRDHKYLIRPFLGGNQENNIDNSVDTVMERNGWQ